MDNNNYIVLSYSLFAEVEGERMLLEQTEEGKPFWFISGMGMTLPKFDEELAKLGRGETFDFVIAKEDAYGEADPERIVELPKEAFVVDGKFDSEHVKKDAQIPLQNEEGQRFWGRVTEITDTQVTVDLNHPLAGKNLHFVGTVIENRDARENEIRQMIDMISGADGCGGCGGCGEGGCGGGCGGGNCGGCD